MTEHPITLPEWGIRALEHGKSQFRVPLDPQPRKNWQVWQDDDNGQWMQSGYGERGDDMLLLPWQVGHRLVVSRAVGPRPRGMMSGHVLTVTGLRVERVGDISEADAVAEGAAHVWGEARPITSFKRSWKKDHPDHPWPDSWVLVTEFER